MSLYVACDYWLPVYAEGDEECRQRGAGRPRNEKRKKWVIGDREVTATRSEIERELVALLETRGTEPPMSAPEAVPVKVAPKDKAIVAAFPSYPDLRDMLIAAQQVEAAQILRAIAQRMADEQDERDIEELIRWE